MAKKRRPAAEQGDQPAPPYEAVDTSDEQVRQDVQELHDWYADMMSRVELVANAHEKARKKRYEAAELQRQADAYLLELLTRIRADQRAISFFRWVTGYCRAAIDGKGAAR